MIVRVAIILSNIAVSLVNQPEIPRNIDKYNELTKEGILNSEDFKEYISLAAERDQINFDGTLTHTILDAQMQQAIEDKNIFAYKGLQHEMLYNSINFLFLQKIK